MTNRNWLITFLVLVLLSSSVSVAWATPSQSQSPPPSRPRPRLRGQVTAIDGESLTVRTRRGEISVLTDENTQFLVPGLAQATIKDLNVGDTVAMAGVRPKVDQPPIAKIVAVLRDAESRPAGVRGQVTAINGDTVTVQPRSGAEVQLLTDENTQFLIPGVQEATLADLAVGDVIGAQTVEREDETAYLYASAIGKRNARPRLRWGAVLGKISAIDGDRITLTTRRGDVELLIDDQTCFCLPGARETGPEALEIGQVIGAIGRWNEGRTLEAHIVGARPAQPPNSIDLP